MIIYSIIINISNVFFAESLSTDTSDLLSNITYNETSGSRISTTDAEVRRAMIYNQLINLGMPLVSDMILADGQSRENDFDP